MKRMIYGLKLSREAGFFSDTFRILPIFLYAYQTGASVKIDSSDWLFKVSKGWSDWFSTLPEPATGLEDSVDESAFKEHKIYTWEMYSEAARYIYQLQPSLLQKVKDIQNELRLQEGEYASVFIRRGDKLYEESVYLPTDYYVKKVLKAYPECRTLFVQTDDIRAVEEIREHFPDLRVVSTCPPDKYGAYVFFYKPKEASDHGLPQNAEYFKSLEEKPEQKIVDAYSSDEMRAHVEEMLIGLELCKRSVVCGLDYQSNTSRYLALTHVRGLEGICPVEGQPFTDATFIKCPRYFPMW